MKTLQELIEIIASDESNSLKENLEVAQKNGFDINTIDDEGNTLLHHAASSGQIKNVQMLLDKKALIKENNRGYRPQEHAMLLADRPEPSNKLKNKLWKLASNVPAETLDDIIAILFGKEPKQSSRTVEVKESKKDTVEEKEFKESKETKEDKRNEEFNNLIKKFQAEIDQLPFKPWLDIPALEKWLDIPFDVSCDQLCTLIENYHTFKKSDKKNLIKRLDLLKKIYNMTNELLESLPANNQTRDEINQLKKLTFGKLCYLKMIAKRELNNNWFKQFIFGGFTPEGNLLRTLRFDFAGDELNLSMKTGDKFGNATPFLDPCLRSGFKEGWTLNEASYFNKLYVDWLQEMEETSDPSNFPSFYMWLEEKDELTKEINPNSPQQAIELLELRKCTINQGQLKLNNISTGLNFKGLFTMNAQGEIFISAPDTWAYVPNHPHTHFGFEPAICGGLITVKNGKIESINNFSGHYQPNAAHFKQFIKIMKEKECLAKNCRIDVYYPKIGDVGHASGTVDSIDFDDIIKKQVYKVRLKDPQSNKFILKELNSSQILKHVIEENAAKIARYELKPSLEIGTQVKQLKTIAKVERVKRHLLLTKNHRQAKRKAEEQQFNNKQSHPKSDDRGPKTT